MKEIDTLTNEDKLHALPDSADSPDGRDASRTRPGGTVSIFRRKAVERYARRGGEQILPRLAAPRQILWLWVLAALLAGGALAAGWTLDSRTAPPAEVASGEAP